MVLNHTKFNIHNSNNHSYNNCYMGNQEKEEDWEINSSLLSYSSPLSATPRIK